MSYSQQTWVNLDPTTPLSAARLTHIESGIAAVDAATATKVPQGAYAGVDLVGPDNTGETNTTALVAYVMTPGLALSTKSPGPGGTDTVYGFIYVGVGRVLFIEAPAAGTLNGGGRIDLCPGGDNLTAGGDQNRVIIAQPGAAGMGNRSGQFSLFDAAGNMVQSVAFGTGAPTIGGETGDLYFRKDTPTTAAQRAYICTTAGAAGSAVWTQWSAPYAPWSSPPILAGESPSIVYNSATWSELGNANSYFSGYNYNSSGAINDGGAWRRVLSPGTWSLKLLALKNASAGQVTVDISFDGGSSWTTLISALDLYNASAVASSTTVTGITVPDTSGPALIRARALGKNASSASYLMQLANIAMWRTA